MKAGLHIRKKSRYSDLPRHGMMMTNPDYIVISLFLIERKKSRKKLSGFVFSLSPQTDEMFGVVDCKYRIIIGRLIGG